MARAISQRREALGIRDRALACWRVPSVISILLSAGQDTTVSLPGPTEHASATRTRGSEEQVAVYSSASTITGGREQKKKPF